MKDTSPGSTGGADATSPEYSERRRDGWPLCPRCGEDELYSLAIPATIETIEACYACNWKRSGVSIGSATLRAAGDKTATERWNARKEHTR